jgi:pseudouridine-5'-phosphate glycosidase
MPEILINEYLDVAPEVSEALASNEPVVALESTIICHGMPWPRNAETAMQVEAAVRDGGAVPATIAILGGRLKVGLDENGIRDLGERGPKIAKTSRRDIPFMVARGEDGATTVAATMIIAAMAGIRVMATGGIGGVHRGVEETMDISADLEELAQTNIGVVCAGIKSVLDVGRTLEYLETVGVPVVGYGTDTVPAFYARSSGFPVDYRVNSPAEAAAALHAKFSLGLDGAMVIGNPVPEADALSTAEIDGVIEAAIRDMNESGITGKETTPFLLARIAEKTGGRSLEANIALILDNAGVAAGIASAYSELDGLNT